MKVLLINPSRIFYEGSTVVALRLPLGIMQIAAVLDKNLINVAIFDCLISHQTRIKEIPDGIHYGVDDDVLKVTVAEQAPDIIGITCPFTAQLDSFLHLAKLVKEVNSDVFVVAGGPHFVTEGKSFLKHNRNIDCFVSGEGEIAMLEICIALREKRSFESINGVTYKTITSKGKIVVQRNPQKLIENLDWLPFPAYHLIDMELFFSLSLEHMPVGIPHNRIISMITSRGCPFNCVFCSVHLHMGKRIRLNSSKYAVNHIQHVVDKYRIDHIFFDDDNFSFDRKRTKEVCVSLEKKDFNITWSTPNGIRVDSLDKNILEIMKASGVFELTVGVESGDQGTLDNIINKNLKLENVVQIAEWCKELQIRLSSFFVIGFPGETKETIQKTIDFACMLYKKYDVTPGLNIATPLIGTKLYNIVIDNGYLASVISPKNLSAATQPLKGKGMIITPEFTPGDLKKYAEQLQVRYFRMLFLKNLLTLDKYYYYLSKIILQPKKTIRFLKKIL